MVVKVVMIVTVVTAVVVAAKKATMVKTTMTMELLEARTITGMIEGSYIKKL